MLTESKSITVYDCLVITTIDRDGFDVLYQPDGQKARLIGYRPSEEAARLLALEYQLGQTKTENAGLRDALDSIIKLLGSYSYMAELYNYGRAPRLYELFWSHIRRGMEALGLKELHGRKLEDIKNVFGK